MKVSEIVGQAAPQHFRDVRRARDLDLEVFRVELVGDSLYPADELLNVPIGREDDHVAGAPILGDQEPFPERALLCIFEVFRSFGQALDTRDGFNRFKLPCEL